MNNIKLSIVIPYYETYEMTMKLLRELAIQYTDEVEIILIDDYCKKEFNNTPAEGINEIILGRIQFKEHKENKGVAVSRNEGIELAKGKYIAFIDSDDMITMDYIETLLNAIDKYDTDVINFNWYDMTTHIEYRSPHNPAVWKAIYKKETMPHFIENMPYGREDVPFQKEIDSGKYSITYLDKMIYLYNSNREGSLFWLSLHENKNN